MIGFRPVKRTRPVVAVDGPSGAGKSTVSKKLAELLGYIHIDTGALYRAVGLAATRRGIAFDDDAKLGGLMESIGLRLEPGTAARGSRIFLDGEDVSDLIRTPEISMAASAVSARKPVRNGLLALQRRLGSHGGAVLEGRDIGTVVFPDAEAKYFLTATMEIRVRRRFNELRAKGMDVTMEQTRAEVEKRDKDDSERDLAPLKPATDAEIVDGDDWTIDQTAEILAEKVHDVERRLGTKK
jgi:cytidylate kinase